MALDVSSGMKRFSGAMIQPVMFLAVAGLLIAVCAILRMTFMPALLVGVGDFIYALMMGGIVNNLAVLFCIGLSCVFARKKKTDAAIIGISTFFVFLQANNFWLTRTGGLIEADSLTGTGQAMVLGVQVVDMGVFIGIILGCLVGYLFNRFCDVKFPDVVRVYGGTRFVFLICSAMGALVGIAACYIWPVFSGALLLLEQFIEGSGNVGLFLYGFLNRVLIPTGMHHLVYTPFIFSSVGGVAEIAGQTYQGAGMIYMAELGNLDSLSAMDPSTKYMIFGFSKIFGSIGTILAFIATAKPEKKNDTRALLLPIGVTAVVAGVTEPLEFMYAFVSPLLFVVHSIMDGIFQVILFVAGYRLPLRNLTEVISSIIVVPADLSHWWVAVPIGAVGIVVWFVVFRALILKFDLKTPGREDDEREQVDGATQGIVETKPDENPDSGDVRDIIDGLGGESNIDRVYNCFTRLRIDVKDDSLVDETVIGRYPSKGIVRGKGNVQIIIGMKVQDVCDAVISALGREPE